MPSQEATARRRYFAMDLATEFIRSFHPQADDDERERIETTILCAGQHLADCGAPGEWNRLDPASFLDKMPVNGDLERLEICVDLAGLFGWLGAEGLIAASAATRVLRALRALCPAEPRLQNLCDAGLLLVATFADSPG